MKTFLLIFVLLLAQPAFAVMRVNNSNALQPMPADVEPNISHNVNYNAPYDPSYKNIEEVVPVSSTIDTTPNNPSNKDEFGHAWIWITVFTTIIGGGLIWGFRKLK